MLAVPPPDPPRSGSPDTGPPPTARSRDHRIIADRYRLDAMIGHGSSGSVWAATDLLLRRRVALKKINIPRGMPPAEADALRERTLREARAAAALIDPHIVTVFDILAATETGPVIVMELVQGVSLAHIIHRFRRLSTGQAATIGVAIGTALMAAHAAGITHRDVKPGNVVIGEEGLIKLTDFGIARMAGEKSITGAGVILGSPAYLAPEVVGGATAGPESDAWSLGVLLFGCVEGRPAFDRGSAMDTVTAVVNDPLPPHPHSGAIGEVVAGLLVKSPNLRLRVDQAVGVLRQAADDPSGTRIELPEVGRTPAESSSVGETTQPSPPPAAAQQELDCAQAEQTNEVRAAIGSQQVS